MTPRNQRRDTWHKTKDGTWTCNLGRRGGIVVRLFENRKSGYYYADVHRLGASRERRTLNTRDRAEADAQGRSIYAQALIDIESSNQYSSYAPGTTQRRSLRLGEVCDRFLKECPDLLDNAPAGQRKAQTQLAIVRSVLGDGRDVATLSKNDARRYEQRRLAGGIVYGKDLKGRKLTTKAVRQRAVQADLKLLKQAFEWACSEIKDDGEPLLLRNPLMGFKAKAETDVRRPVAEHSRYLATRAAMVARQQHYEGEAAQEKRPKARRRAESRAHTWIRAEMALALIHATGRRRGSIAALRWDDIDFDARRILWRAESDKKRTTWRTGYPPELFGELQDFRSRLGGKARFLFPRLDDLDEPTPPELLSQWIAKAETDAGLPKLEGSLCHAYRRKWKSDRSHHPIKAVADAGGWKDIGTMLKCYEISDDVAILEVTSSPRYRLDNSASGHCPRPQSVLAAS